MLKKYIRNDALRSVLEWLLAAAAAVLLFFFLRVFLRVASVTGNSMEPTLNHGDMVILSKLTYVFSDPKPGDIVAFPYKENPSEYYIKRVVGVPGDVIDIRDSRFTVNGVPLDDAFSGEPVVSYGNASFPYTVEKGCYFVLGDNRNNSRDSRYTAVGVITEKQMLGKVVLRFKPVSRFGFVK